MNKRQDPSVMQFYAFLHVADEGPISVSKERFGHAMYLKQVQAPRSSCVSNSPPAQAGRQIANMIIWQLTVFPLWKCCLRCQDFVERCHPSNQKHVFNIQILGPRLRIDKILCKLPPFKCCLNPFIHHFQSFQFPTAEQQNNFTFPWSQNLAANPNSQNRNAEFYPEDLP